MNSVMDNRGRWRSVVIVMGDIADGAVLLTGYPRHFRVILRAKKKPWISYPPRPYVYVRYTPSTTLGSGK